MTDRLKNNLGLKILAVIFAIFLWWIVVNIDDPMDSKQYMVEVSVINPEIVTNAGNSYQIEDTMKNVSVTVRARRKVLDKIRKSDIIATADLREMQDSSVPVRVQISGYEGNYEEATANPRNIQVIVENTLKKTFPITTVATGTTRDGYVVGTMAASPQTIDISGPESMINKIHKVVAKIDVSEMSADATLQGTLIYYDAADNVLDKNLLSSNCDKNGVSIIVDIWRTKKVNLQFDTSWIRTAKGFLFTGIEVEPQTLRVAGTTESLSAFVQLDIGPEVLEKKDLSENEEVIVDVTQYLPEGIVLADANGKQVAVRILVEKVGTKSVLLPVGSIQILNAPDKFKIEKGSAQEVELQFSGTAEALANLSASTIVASIDLTEYTQKGSYSVPIQITELPEGCTYVGDAAIEIILSKK